MPPRSATQSSEPLAWTEPGGQQLAAVGLHQIQVQAGADGRMAGSALRQEEHGVLVPHLVSVVNLAEKLACVGELRLELESISSPTA